MKKDIFSLIAHFLFIWSAAMIAWLLLGLIMFDGEVIIREPSIWVRIIETIIAFGILGFSVGLLIGFIRKSRLGVDKK